MYFKRLLLAVLGKSLPVNDWPVREAHMDEIHDLARMIPPHIENSTDRTSSENLFWMISRLVREIQTFPVDKQGRWIGFIHGVLALSGHLDVDEVRNRSRGRYHKAYIATGQVIPETKTLETHG